MLERPGGGFGVARVAAVEVILLRPTAREKAAGQPSGVGVAADATCSVSELALADVMDDR